MGEIMSRSVETLGAAVAKPLVKVYTAKPPAEHVLRISKISGSASASLCAKSCRDRAALDAAGPGGPADGLEPDHQGPQADGARAAAATAPPGTARRRSRAAKRLRATRPPTEAAPARPAASPGSGANSTPQALIFAAWLDARRSGRRQYVEAALPHLDAVRTRDPWAVDATVAAAESFLAHRFDLLGSGPFTPVDPDRPARDGYQPIDWYLDPVRQLRFPRGVPHKEWKLL